MNDAPDRQTQIDPDNPWPGLSAYSEQASVYFFGRGDEVSELSRRVRRNLLTLLFGQSGLGKTSLLHAGLFPNLRSDRYLPIALRLEFSTGAAELVEQVRLRIQQVMSESGLDDSAFPRENETLWEYFHRRGDPLRGPDGLSRVPVLVFDQFEEIFTLGESGRKSGSVRFLTELSDLVENRPPKEIEERLEADLDAADCYEFGKADYRILLSLREDYLAHLEDLRGLMPSLSQNRIRLNPMSDRQAIDAVLLPGGDLVTPSLAEDIVRFVSGAASGDRFERTTRIEVEPSLLSLFCHELNNKRQALQQTKITPDLLAGSSEAILQDFYERCLADQAPAVRRFLEDQLLTDSGFRESIALERARKLLGQQGAPPSAVDQLVDRRLLHVEERLNVRRVELTHDILTGVVRGSRDSRRAREEKEESERQRKLAEAQRHEAEERERLTRRQLRRAKMLAAAFGVLLVAALAAATWAFLADREARRETARAVEAEKIALREKELAQRRDELARRTAIQSRERIQDFNSQIVRLADKLIQNATAAEVPLLHEIKASALSPLGRHREAVVEDTIALDINPTLVWPRMGRGFEYSNIEETKSALDDYEYALRIGARGPVPYLHKGLLLGYQGRYDEAARAMQSGIGLSDYTFEEFEETELPPEVRRATYQTVLYAEPKEWLHAFYLQIATLKASAGDAGFAAALKAADDHQPNSNGGALFAVLWAWRQMTNRPADYGALAAEGALWDRAGFKDWAKQYYLQFTQTHSAKRAARYGDLAIWVAQRLKELQDTPLPEQNHPDPSLLQLEAKELIQKGNAAEARVLLDQAVVLAPDDFGLLLFRAFFFLQNKGYKEAVKDCDAVIARAPRTANAYSCRGVAKANLSAPEQEVEADLRKAIECDPHNSDAFLCLSYYLDRRDPEQALKLQQRSVEEGMDFGLEPIAYWRISYLKNGLHQYKEAAEAARLAIAMKSDASNYYESLYQAELGLGKSPQVSASAVSDFCKTLAESRSALGQKWNAFSTCFAALNFLAGLTNASNGGAPQPEFPSLLSGVSNVLGGIGAGEEAIAFWDSASDWFKVNDNALTKEAFIQSAASKNLAINFWKSVIQSGKFKKEYAQFFQGEIDWLEATAASGNSSAAQ
jgi:tetratricopeptide (TPR) repeat protein